MSHWFHDASDSERKLMLDCAQDAVRETAAAMAEQHKRRKVDPRSPADYKAWKTMKMVAVPLVKRGDKPASIEAAMGGSAAPRVFLPNSQMLIQPESRDQFVLAVIPKWLAQARNLMGVPGEIEDTATSSEKAAWSAIQNTAMSINVRISNANYRRSIMTRNHAA